VSTQKIYFFTRPWPWLAGKFIFLTGHGRGRSKKQFFHPDTAVAGRKINFFTRTRPWQGEKTLIFTKNAHFPPKTEY